MKKLITICLLIATSFTVNAQTKPSKVETVAYINRLCESTVGKTTPKSDMKETIIKSSFNYDKYIFEYLPFEEGVNYVSTVSIWSLIKWENYISVSFPYRVNHGEEMKIEDSLTDIGYLSVNFSTNLLNKQNDNKGYYTSSFYLYYPLSKKENLIKAFKRLSEIAKEENKDPFEK